MTEFEVITMTQMLLSLIKEKNLDLKIANIALDHIRAQSNITPPILW